MVNMLQDGLPLHGAVCNRLILGLADAEPLLFVLGAMVWRTDLVNFRCVLAEELLFVEDERSGLNEATYDGVGRCRAPVMALWPHCFGEGSGLV
jgi:hypothetical protein